MCGAAASWARPCAPVSTPATTDAPARVPASRSLAVSPATATSRTSSIPSARIAASTRSGCGRPRTSGLGLSARSTRSCQLERVQERVEGPGREPRRQAHQHPGGAERRDRLDRAGDRLRAPGGEARAVRRPRTPRWPGCGPRLVTEQLAEHLDLGATHRGPQVLQASGEAVGVGSGTGLAQRLDEGGLDRAVVAHRGPGEVEDGETDHRGGRHGLTLARRGPRRQRHPDRWCPVQPLDTGDPPDGYGPGVRILVTNDDGVEAPGLRALAQALVADGHDVVVVAPDGERSGAGAAIGWLHRSGPISHQDVDWPDLPGVAVHALGTQPAATVYAAGFGAFGPPPELVASGVNRGLNTGHLVLHSGTVGAALTAAVLGLPAVAVSLAWGEEEHWATAARLAAASVPSLIDGPARCSASTSRTCPSRRCSGSAPARPHPFDEVLDRRAVPRRSSSCATRATPPSPTLTPTSGWSEPGTPRSPCSPASPASPRLAAAAAITTAAGRDATTPTR